MTLFYFPFTTPRIVAIGPKNTNPTKIFEGPGKASATGLLCGTLSLMAKNTFFVHNIETLRPTDLKVKTNPKIMQILHQMDG